MGAFRRDLLLVPNLLSLGRIALIGVATALLLEGRPLAALAVGVPAGVTDYLDGWLARRRGEVTDLGALLDGLADVILHLFCLTAAHATGVWPVYLVFVWGLRDLSVMTLRASAARRGFTIPSSLLAKVAMNVNGYAYVLMALDLWRPVPRLAGGVHLAGLVAIHAGLALQWLSFGRYLAAHARGYDRRPPGAA